MTFRRSRSYVAVVALGVQPLRQLLTALLGHPTGDEHMHVVRLDVAQNPGVVSDQQHAAIALRREAVDSVGDHPQRVDVEPGVRLVEDRETRVQQLELDDFVPLLLPAGEALVEAPVGEVGIHLDPFHGGIDFLDPGTQLGSLTIERRLGGPQEVRH